MKVIITATVVTKMSDLSLIWFLTCCPLRLSELFRGWLRKSHLRLVGWLVGKGLRVTSVVYMSVHVWVCGGQGKHTYTGHLGEGWVCNYREEEKGGGLPFLSLSEVWMQHHREVGGKSERNSWYFKRNLWAPTCFTLILFLSLFKSNKLSLEVERKGFCLKKCLILESTHTWRELFQILKVCYVFFCISFTPSVRHFHWLKAKIDQ